MPKLPPRPDLDQLRRQAKDLLQAARAGQPGALRRIGSPVALAGAQRATARRYGFPSWPKLKIEVERRGVFDRRDPDELRALISEDPSLATEDMRNWSDHGTIAPLSYVALMRCVTGENVWRDMPGSGVIAQLLIDAGALVDGAADEPETPLMTAASYGDAEVARVLVRAGASLDVFSKPDAGGVPNATALRHAAVFGNTEVLDVLVAAGAKIDGITQAAAVGDLSGWDLSAVSDTDRVLALIMAANHQRLDTIDALLDAGTPVDAEDEVWGRQALRLAASRGRPRSVAHLLARGADPTHRDPQHGRTALEWCRRDRVRIEDGAPFDEVEAILSAARP